MSYRRIYYDKETGNKIIHIAFEREYVIRSVEQDIVTYTTLSNRNRETFDVVELSLEMFSQDFAEGRLIGVDLETKIPIFEYPNPENPEEPIVPPVPLSIEVEVLKTSNISLESYILDLDYRLIMQEMGL